MPSWTKPKGTTTRRRGSFAWGTLLPAIVFVVVMGLAWQALTQPESAADISQLQEMGMVSEESKEAPALDEPQADGIQEPPAETVEEPVAEGVQAPPAEGLQEHAAAAPAAAAPA